ncbi:MAG TPA: dCMP deaminase family protein [Candidatus Thermoplasmatota archaeon]|nr:dCMP deaminase family protein [Candidatus Thermoplasmatota archaeon]
MDGERPSVDQYFMDMTHLVKSRGTCPRRQVGAVVVKDKRVLTTGYNGAPRNFPHPIDVGCLRDELNIPRGMVADICPCLHAEQNAILQAATTGVSIEGADLYCTTQPCTQCSRMVANCGMRRVVFEEEYPDPLAIGILTTARVELWRWDAQAKLARRVESPNTFEQAQEELRRRHRGGQLVPAPRPGQLPMAAATLPIAPLPPPPQPAEPAVGTEGAEDARPAGIRDVTRDAGRQDLLRAMAKERVERRRQAREGGPA